MKNYIAERNQMAADTVIAALKRRHIEGVYAENKETAHKEGTFE